MIDTAVQIAILEELAVGLLWVVYRLHRDRRLP